MEFTSEDEFNKHLVAAKVAEGWEVSNLGMHSLPSFTPSTKTSKLAFAHVGVVSKGTDKHVVVVAYAPDEYGSPMFRVTCGDKYLEEAGMTSTLAVERVTQALEEAGVAATQMHSVVVSHATYPNGVGPCTFWANWRRNQTLCEHSETMLAHLQNTRPLFKEELIQGYTALVATNKAPEVKGATLSLDELAFRTPVLIEGDRGAGKSVTANRFCKEGGYPRVLLPGHEGVEALDMLGCMVQGPDGRFVWKDGALSEAFRKAKQSKVVLVIDELLRIRMRELSILLTALSPDDGEYFLRTGRIISIDDGVAQEETLSCKTENLCVIATTNVGSEYAVDQCDPALAERFVILRLDTSEAELKRILSEVAKKQSLPDSIVAQCMNFYRKMVEAQVQGLVAMAPTTRTMTRALWLSNSAAEVKRALLTHSLLWVARTSDGKPVTEQVATVSTLIESQFKEVKK